MNSAKEIGRGFGPFFFSGAVRRHLQQLPRPAPHRDHPVEDPASAEVVLDNLRADYPEIYSLFQEEMQRQSTDCPEVVPVGQG